MVKVSNRLSERSGKVKKKEKDWVSWDLGGDQAKERNSMMRCVGWGHCTVKNT